MRHWLIRMLYRCLHRFRWLLWWVWSPARSHQRARVQPKAKGQVFSPPKPTWVRNEVIRFKALMPHAGCRTVAHHFNRRWASRRQVTVGKSYVAMTLRKHQYLVLEARRKLKHRVPQPMPRNRVWACDLLTRADQQGTMHLGLAIVDHATRACLRLQRLSEKSSWRLLQELSQAVKQYGRPQYLRTDNEAVFTSGWFTGGLRLLGIRHQRTEPGCPWQNGRVERFIGTVKRGLKEEPLTSDKDFEAKLTSIRLWYNHDRPHDHLQGRTPAEVWAGIDVLKARSS